MTERLAARGLWIPSLAGWLPPAVAAGWVERSRVTTEAVRKRGRESQEEGQGEAFGPGQVTQRAIKDK